MTMPKFAVVMKQHGEGCDYSIGCGMKLVELKAVTLEEARIEARVVVQGIPSGDSSYGYEESMLVDYDHEYHCRLAYARIVHVEEDLPILQWHAEIKEAIAGIKRNDQQAKDRAEYDRLKKQFG